MSKKWLLILIVFSLVSIALAIPQTFNINGKLTDSNGVALAGDYNFNFSIYNNATGGTYLWNSGVLSVTTDSNGIYHVILNNVNLNFSEQYFLGIRVGTDSEMSPRLNLTSSPYAYMAQNVTVGGIIFDANIDAGARNFTTTGTGFFGWLGSLTSRISGLFVTDIQFNGNINGSGNITTSGRGNFTFTNTSASLEGIPGLSVGNGTTGFVRIGSSGWYDDGTYFSPTGTKSFYIRSGTPNTYIYSPSIYLGNVGGTTTYLRENTITGGNFSIAPAGSSTYFSRDGGNFVIGTATPTHKLNVVGTSNFTGNIYSSGNITLSDLNSVLYLAGGTSNYIDFANAGLGDPTSTAGWKLALYNNPSDSGAYGLGVSAGQLWLHSDADIALWSSQVQRVLWDESDNSLEITGNFSTTGNIGIGTSTPSNKLDVRGDINASAEIYVKNGTAVSPWLYNQTAVSGTGNLSGGGTAGYIPQFSGTSGLNSSPIYTSGGSVGIGTLTPTHKLDVDLGVVTGNDQIDENQGFRVSGDATGNTGWAGYLISLNSSTENITGVVRLARTSGTAFLGMEMASKSRDGIRFLTNTSGLIPTDERMRITSAGLVGIGTHAPTSLLHVNGTGALLNVTSGATSILSANGTTVAVGSGRILTSLGGPQGTQPILTVFNNATLNNVNYTAIGFGIYEGINNPRASIFVDNSNHTTGFSSTYTSGGLDFVITTGGTERFRISGGVNAPSGRVGIGTTIPESMLNVIGDANITTNLSVGGNLFVNSSSIGIGGTAIAQAQLSLQNTNSSYIIIKADTDNVGGENENPAIGLLQDGSSTMTSNTQVGGFVGLTSVGKSPFNALFTDSLNDALLIGTIYTGSEIQFGVNNTVAMTILDGGNVGIGTTAPSNKLDVRGDINASGNIYFNNGTLVGLGNVSGGGTANYIPQWSGTSTLNNSPIYTTGGFVGIGTTNPVNPLHIVSSAGTVLNISAGAASANMNILLHTVGTTKYSR